MRDRGAGQVLPEGMGNCKSLVRLDLSTNNLHSLPRSLSRLKKLQRLCCANNMLRRVPSSLGQIRGLKEFDLRYNNLDEQYKAKSEEGLSRFLAFLRDEAERERLEEIERLKPIGTQVGSFVEYRCKADPEKQLLSEEGLVSGTLDNRCWLRTGQTMMQAGSFIYLFGGVLQRDGAKTNDVYWLTTDSMEWNSARTSGEKPAPRDGHCAVFDSATRRLIVFGGRQQGGRRLADVHYLDTDTWKWYRPTMEGVGPCARSGAACLLQDGRLYIFGGSVKGARMNDLWTLDLSSFMWREVVTSGNAPSPRQFASVCAGGGLLFLHGGRSNFVLEDLFVLDLVTKTWAEVVLGSEESAPARHSHVSAIHDGHLYIYGGLNELGSTSDNMMVLETPSVETNLSTFRPTWKEVRLGQSYKRSRVALFHNGHINMLQTGSSSGPVPPSATAQEDVVKTDQYWDTYLTARLSDFKIEGATDNETNDRPGGNAKENRIFQSTTLKLSKSITSNSPKEEAILDYADRFVRMFGDLYPRRRRPFLKAHNEGGTVKLVCTALRPSMLAHTQLLTLKGAADFVANFFAYEQLQTPSEPPAHLPSPASVLSWQRGDSFDLANLLCSILLGAGFDAYVAVGYAPRALALNDLSQLECPWLAASEVPSGEHVLLQNVPPPLVQGPSDYNLKVGVSLSSASCDWPGDSYSYSYA
eukprot:jgi/Botrbrau1/2810/Bobra.0125s0021.1